MERSKLYWYLHPLHPRTCFMSGGNQILQTRPKSCKPDPNEASNVLLVSDPECTRNAVHICPVRQIFQNLMTTDIRLDIARVGICEENRSPTTALRLNISSFAPNVMNSDLFVRILLVCGFVKKTDHLREHFVWMLQFPNTSIRKLIHSFESSSRIDL